LHRLIHLALLAVLLAPASVLLAGPAAAQVTQVYQTKYRSAEELAPLAEGFLGPEGRVVADRRTNLLVLSGSRENVATALKLLAKLDVRPRSVLIRYESRTTRELAALGAEIRWSAGTGGVRIGNVRWPGARSGAALRVGQQSGTHTGTLAGTLRILDGESGRIGTGTSVPVPMRRVIDDRRGPRVVESTQYVGAESGFEARPRVLGDGRIELALRPFDASVRADGTVSGTGADTILILEPGRSVALGGILRTARDQHAGALSGGGSRDAAEETLLVVSAELE
jgi:type II secretory pathway component GspD/PulD (secretin)